MVPVQHSFMTAGETIDPLDADLQVAPIVGGAEGEAGEKGDDKRGHRRLGGPKGAPASAVHQEAQCHVDGHVVAEEHRPSSVLRALGHATPQACTRPNVSKAIACPGVWGQDADV